MHGYTVREQPLGFKRSTIELKPPSEEFKLFYLCAENVNENKRYPQNTLREFPTLYITPNFRSTLIVNDLDNAHAVRIREMLSTFSGLADYLGTLVSSDDSVLIYNKVKMF